MCKLGDIIVIDKFKNEYGDTISKHSFVITSDKNNEIEGVPYDFVSNMLCSFHSEEHKQKKLKQEENIEIKYDSVFGKNINHKNGYIKADQLYFFNKKEIKYTVIAKLNPVFLEELLKVILILDKKKKLKTISTNLPIDQH